MTSINKNQPEQNREDLHHTDAIDKIRELVNIARTCFFCTSVGTGDSAGARPMNVRQVDDQGNLWFLSPNDSHQNKELTIDPNVKLYFQGSPHSDFLHLNGRATISTDKAKIKELWEPIIKTWFTEGGRSTHHRDQGHANRRILLGHKTWLRSRRYQNDDRCGNWQNAR